MRWVPRPLFRNLTGRAGVISKPTIAETNAAVDVGIDFKAILDLSRTSSPSMAARMVASGVRSKLARTLHVPEDIELQKPMHAFGVDSLMAVELRYWFQRELHVELSVFELMSDLSISKLSWLVLEKSGISSVTQYLFIPKYIIIIRRE
ncbi:hypothetical protein BDV12DRAFT_112461 [Aspergillus spectabilis]